LLGRTGVDRGKVYTLRICQRVFDLTLAEAIEATADGLRAHATISTVHGCRTWTFAPDLEHELHAIQRALDGLEDDEEFIAECAAIGIVFADITNYPEWYEDGNPTSQRKVEVGDLGELLGAATVSIAEQIAVDDFSAANIVKLNPRVSNRGADIACWRIDLGTDAGSDALYIIESKASYTAAAPDLLRRAERSSAYSVQQLFRIITLLSAKLKDRDRNDERAKRMRRLLLSHRTAVVLGAFLLTSQDPRDSDAAAFTTPLRTVGIAYTDVERLRQAVYIHRREGGNIAHR
jgi:hypothetical protein